MHFQETSNWGCSHPFVRVQDQRASLIKIRMFIHLTHNPLQEIEQRAQCIHQDSESGLISDLGSCQKVFFGSCIRSGLCAGRQTWALADLVLSDHHRQKNSFHLPLNAVWCMGCYQEYFIFIALAMLQALKRGHIIKAGLVRKLCKCNLGTIFSRS